MTLDAIIEDTSVLLGCGDVDCYSNEFIAVDLSPLIGKNHLESTRNYESAIVCARW